MQHRKKEHAQIVAFCKNDLKGTCHFGVNNCWFNHNENKNENRNRENLNDMTVPMT